MQLGQTSEEISKGKQRYSHLAPSCQEHTVTNHYHNVCGIL